MTHRVILNSPFARERAKRIIDQAPKGYVMEARELKRTLEQNSRFWAMLTSVALSKPLGRMHTPEEWKCIFMSACGWEIAFLPGLDGRFLPYGYSSSKMSKKQMTDLMDFIQAWGDQNGVIWNDESREAA